MPEERGVLQMPEQHGKGVKWVFRADVPKEEADR
jgi:hypothetical protein